MIILTNYNQAGFTSPNSVRFVRSDSRPSQRKDLSVSRKESVYSSNTKVYSIPEYRSVFRSDAVSDGVPTGQRMTIDLVVRTPLGSESDTFDEVFTDFLAFVQDPEFKDSVLRQLFPIDCNCD